MQQFIDQILEGNFGYENGSLDFSCAKLEITLSGGDTYEGSFLITTSLGRPAEGIVTTSDFRMECLTPSFLGVSEEIGFCFHADGLEEGEVVKGEFDVISNQGEYYLPFVVSVAHTQLSSSIGDIRNLFHFANLAKTNWQEAVSLFYSPLFERILQGSDQKYYDSYRGFCVYPGREQNVEEFLIEVNKKQQVEYEAKESVLTLENPIAVSEMTLTIMRIGWGYTRLHVVVDGDFAFTEKTVLTEDDFLGNSCRLPVYVDSSMLHRGKNYGQLTLRNSYVSLTVPIVVRVGEGPGLGSIRKDKKRLVVQLMEFYQAFRLKKISTSTWLKETGRLVESMVAIDDKDISARLFQAQLLLTEERYHEAGWILDHAAELLGKKKKRKASKEPFDPILEAYYLYLTTLTDRKESYVDQVTERVEQIYRKNRSSWRIAWLLLYLSRDYSKSPSAKWLFLEKQSDYGCTSPVLYIEALQMLNHNPALLRRLDTFEMQVLRYGAGQEMLSEELTEQLLYLVGRVREYSQALFCILESCYNKRPDVRILREICVLLIKGGKAGISYFSWYRQGVENELRITKLYEYYMMSVDISKEQELPKMVLMYFSYQNNLDYEHSAFLYYYVLRHRGEFPELYEIYRGRMEQFVVQQIHKEHVSRHLAGLYEELLTPEIIGPQTAPALSKILFAHMIRVEKPGIRKIVVYQPGYLRETVYSCSGCATWVALYGNDYTILFEDGEENRFTKSVPYTLEKLLLPGRLSRLISPYVNENIAFDLYLCESGREMYEFSGEGTERSLRIIESDEVGGEVKRELSLKVLHYMYDHDDMRRMDTFLEQLPVKDLSSAERGEVFKYIVLRGKYDMAYEWLKEYGPCMAEPKTLVRLLSEIMQQTDFVEEGVLTGAAVYVFGKGKYDGNILRYLAAYYKGLTRNMRDIWKAARDFDVNCCKLCENMILQMLYTGSYVGEKMEIFRYYLSQGADISVEEAFLVQCSYDYFVREQLTENTIFEEIFRMSQRGESVRQVCRLAFLKYYSENKEEITAAKRPVLRQFLKEAVQEGIHLSFFRDYQDFGDLLYPLMDKTIIEYHAHPQSRVVMHYVIVQDNGEAGEYRQEEMTPVYGGVYFKEFILFFGETLQYYIVEQQNGQEELTRSGIIQKTDQEDMYGSSKFELVNDIVICKILEDYDTLDNMLMEYYGKEYVNRRLFTLR